MKFNKFNFNHFRTPEELNDFGIAEVGKYSFFSHSEGRNTPMLAKPLQAFLYTSSWQNHDHNPSVRKLCQIAKHFPKLKVGNFTKCSISDGACGSNLGVTRAAAVGFGLWLIVPVTTKNT